MSEKELYTNMDLQSQLNNFLKIIKRNPNITEVCEQMSLLDLENYYLGAGCLTQTVWNYLSGCDLNQGINDFDLVYFDEDISFEKEDMIINQVSGIFKDFPLEIDIKNQARVHLWYTEHFGYKIEPYKSVEEAINTWPTTATAIGVRIGKDGQWKVYAPFGLNDLMGKVVRANKVQITKDIYQKKYRRWLKFWPDLKIIPWVG